MGACSSRAPPVVEVGGAEPRPAAGKTPAASKRSARSSKRLGLGLGMSSRRSQDRWREEKSRSLVGNLMQTHTDEGPNALRLEDEYDNSTARVLGTGMSGQVITVKKRATGVEYAVKTLQIDQMGVDGLEALRSEINAMRRLDHPNIVKLFETFEDRELQQIHMIMELCTGGELVAQVTESRHGLPELDVARLLSKMISALSHCHANDVVHRDVKLENFVYESEGEGAELKMIDFGLSHLGRPDKGIEAKGRVGTLSYMAPEVLNRKPYAKECDMWSLGVVAYIMLSGRRPFHHKDRHEKIELIRHAEPAYDGSAWGKVSDLAIEFVASLLVKEPGSRLTARQALDHPWITACRDELNKQAGREPDSPATAIMRNPQMLREIQAFSSLNGMHKVALELLAFGAPSAEVDRLRALFNAIDTDGSGAISRDEFASAMKGHPQLKESEVLHLFEQLDFSKQGEVSYNEFLAATLGMAAGPIDEDRVRVVFERLDTDGDGIVTRDDLLGALGTATSRSDIDNWFEQMGVNSGKIFFHDMLRLMTERRDKTKAGVHATSGGSIGSGPAGKHPSLAQLGRALSASNVTLQTDAKVAERRQTELAPKGLSGRWLSRGRTVQNLNKLIASAQGSAGVPSASGTASAASGPPSPAAPGSTHKRRSIDGGTMIATS